MLIYHPAYDIYHTTYRILNLLRDSRANCLEVERVRIYDFLLLFPHELKNMKLPAGHTEMKKKYKETEYNKVPSRNKVFSQIRNYFDLAVQCLISYGALDVDHFNEGLLCKSPKFGEIMLKLQLDTKPSDADLMRFFSDVFSKIPLSELKERFQ